MRTAGNTLMLAQPCLTLRTLQALRQQKLCRSMKMPNVYWQWQHGHQLIWTCRLSAHNDYHGNKLLLTAEAQQNGKTYQLLYVMPALQADNYLPRPFIP